MAIPASLAASASFGPTPERVRSDISKTRGPRPVNRGRAKAARGRARGRRRRSALLGGEQPPPARLTPLVGLDLDPVGNVGIDLCERDRRPLAGDHGDDLSPLGEVGDRRGKGRTGATPGDDLAVPTKPTASPSTEATLGVIAGRGRNPAACDSGERWR